ncbi:hypothetical protein BKA70DRAFT_1400855 [Coprinopsis sp. MPI-PUGE-AT-0042]|nr:hypothetical protein BKA70DRAFT_1400855 [Coprinopsis sp. MPI-PUGE-AT-0042]
MVKPYVRIMKPSVITNSNYNAHPVPLMWRRRRMRVEQQLGAQTIDKKRPPTSIIVKNHGRKDRVQIDTTYAMGQGYRDLWRRGNTSRRVSGGTAILRVLFNETHGGYRRWRDATVLHLSHRPYIHFKNSEHTLDGDGRTLPPGWTLFRGPISSFSSAFCIQWSEHFISCGRWSPVAGMHMPTLWYNDAGDLSMLEVYKCNKLPLHFFHDERQ